MSELRRNQKKRSDLRCVPNLVSKKKFKKKKFSLYYVICRYLGSSSLIHVLMSVTRYPVSVSVYVQVHPPFRGVRVLAMVEVTSERTLFSPLLCLLGNQVSLVNLHDCLVELRYLHTIPHRSTCIGLGNEFS